MHASRIDEVVSGLSARLQKTRLDYGLDAGTAMGPLHSPAQKQFLDALIQEAKDSGFKVLEFGELPGGDMKGGPNAAQNTCQWIPWNNRWEKYVAPNYVVCGAP